MSRIIKEVGMINAAKPSQTFGCELTFEGQSSKGTATTVRIMLDAWAVGYLGEQLRSWMTEAQKNLRQIEKDMTGH